MLFRSATAVLALLFLGWTMISLTHKWIVVTGSIFVVVAWLAALGSNLRKREGWAFFWSALATLFVVVTLSFAPCDRFFLRGAVDYSGCPRVVMDSRAFRTDVVVCFRDRVGVRYGCLFCWAYLGSSQISTEH